MTLVADQLSAHRWFTQNSIMSNSTTTRTTLATTRGQIIELSPSKTCVCCLAARVYATTVIITTSYKMERIFKISELSNIVVNIQMKGMVVLDTS